MNPSTVLARALLDELVHQGVREVVLAPGSRSAPLAFAALRLAQADRIRLHVRVDERSAGFLALGLAKVSGAPVAVVCTSGTALANLAPAVVEASYSAVPLVVVSADRPVEARGVGAPQTIDQVEFFGGVVRCFADLGADQRGEIEDPEAAPRAARAAVGRCIAAAVGVVGAHARPAPGPDVVAHGGPVHLNVGFRLPLVPEVPAGAGAGPDPVVAVPSPARVRRPPMAGCDVRELGEVLGEVPARGVLLVGDLPCNALRGPHLWLVELASGCGWPIVAEPSANLHEAPTALGHGVLVLGSPDFLAEHAPDLVLSVGMFGLSRPTVELLRRAGRHVAIELPTVGREVCDPARTAREVLTSIPLPPSGPVADPGWLAAWRAADAVAAEVVAEQVGADPSAPLTGSAVAARTWAAAPADGLLLVAASWPVRQVEAVAGARAGLRVIGNRGANGIDGLVSTAWGAALADQAAGGGPALALLGDLAFLHDHNGLLVGPAEPIPHLVVVVVDNDGGGIFHQLEQGRADYADAFERLFGTPQGRDLVAVARAAGIPARRVRTGSQLDEALVGALAAPGGVHVIVADAPDRAGEAALLDRIRAEVSARLAGPGAG